MSYAEIDTLRISGAPRSTGFPAVVWGAGGLAGAELLRLLSIHPNFALTAALSRSLAGRSVGEVHPSLPETRDLVFQDPEEWDWKGGLPEGPGIVFTALAHGESMLQLPTRLDELAQGGYRVVDLSGDFRLASVDEYEAYHQRPHASPDYLGTFVYGLTELNRKWLPNSMRVANPGCFATGAELAILPLANSGIQVWALAIDGKTGSTGAGLTPGPATHHPLRAGNCEAYKLQGHAHLGEILAGWRAAGGDSEVEISFVPQRTPLVRGIYTTVHAFLQDAVEESLLQEVYEDYYSGSPLLRVLTVPPALNRVAGTGRCDLSVHSLGRHVVICSAIDNLLKGAAGQAVQNANLMFGLDEAAGLLFPPPWPM